MYEREAIGAPSMFRLIHSCVAHAQLLKLQKSGLPMVSKNKVRTSSQRRLPHRDSRHKRNRIRGMVIAGYYNQNGIRVFFQQQHHVTA